MLEQELWQRRNHTERIFKSMSTIDLRKIADLVIFQTSRLCNLDCGTVSRAR